ncbi:MAG TPA: hypothetical protein VHQ90_25130 [Thermoanaerobaculia bacterium]|nr:hypothetical protein [Thermoanaerobaculia bacterium]
MSSLSIRLSLGEPATKRLLDLLERSSPENEYTFPRLVDLVQPPSPANLAQVLAKLEEKGLVKRVLRLESPAVPGAGIRDFHSLDEVPTVAYDDKQDLDVPVELEKLRVIYSLP